MISIPEIFREIRQVSIFNEAFSGGGLSACLCCHLVVMIEKAYVGTRLIPFSLFFI